MRASVKIEIPKLLKAHLGRDHKLPRRTYMVSQEVTEETERSSETRVGAVAPTARIGFHDRLIAGGDLNLNAEFAEDGEFFFRVNSRVSRAKIRPWNPAKLLAVKKISADSLNPLSVRRFCRAPWPAAQIIHQPNRVSADGISPGCRQSLVPLSIR